MNLKVDHTPQKMLTKEGWRNLCSGHPWVRKSHLKGALPYSQPGLLHWGEHWFFYSPQSQIPLRRFGPSERHWYFQEKKNSFFVQDPVAFEGLFSDWISDFFLDRLKIKQSFFVEDACFRWIFSESDLIPGLIVDCFDSILVCQIQSAPIELFWPVLENALKIAYETFYGKQPKILLKKDSSVRLKEGLARETSSDENSQMLTTWNGLKWWMSPGGSQKTGSYLDQRVNHLKAAEWAKKLNLSRAWDLCCFEGGFGLHLAKTGLQVLAVDQSEKALAVAQKNAAENGLSSLFSTEQGDVFDWIREQQNSVDCIVLDPPSFVKDAKSKMGALRGFKELNLRAMKQLSPGGLLVTCVCSHHISRLDFEKMLQSAAHDTRRGFNVLDTLGPSPDHAPALHFPEGVYLQAWFLRLL